MHHEAAPHVTDRPDFCGLRRDAPGYSGSAFVSPRERNSQGRRHFGNARGGNRKRGGCSYLDGAAFERFRTAGQRSGPDGKGLSSHRRRSRIRRGAGGPRGPFKRPGSAPKRLPHQLPRVICHGAGRRKGGSLDKSGRRRKVQDRL